MWHKVDLGGIIIRDVDQTVGVLYDPDTELWAWKSASLVGFADVTGACYVTLSPPGRMLIAGEGIGDMEHIISPIGGRSYYKKEPGYYYYCNPAYGNGNETLSVGLLTNTFEYVVGDNYGGDTFWGGHSGSTIQTTITPSGYQRNLRDPLTIDFKAITIGWKKESGSTLLGVYPSLSGGEDSIIGWVVLTDSSGNTYTQIPNVAGLLSSFSSATATGISVRSSNTYDIGTYTTSANAGYYTYTGNIPKKVGETATFIRVWTGPDADPTPGNKVISFDSYTGSGVAEESLVFQVGIWL